MISDNCSLSLYQTLSSLYLGRWCHWWTDVCVCVCGHKVNVTQVQPYRSTYEKFFTQLGQQSSRTSSSFLPETESIPHQLTCYRVRPPSHWSFLLEFWCVCVRCAFGLGRCPTPVGVAFRLEEERTFSNFSLLSSPNLIISRLIKFSSKIVILSSE